MADVIEAAATGRAKCRGCGQRLFKDALRFGERVDNPFGDGEATHWFHLLCAADKRPLKLQAVLEEFSGDLPERAVLEQIAALGVANPKLMEIRQVERASTGRARCRQCRELIEKNALRVALERTDDGMTSGAGFLHLGCAAPYCGEGGLRERLERRSSELDAADRKELAEVLAQQNTANPAT